MPSYTLRSRKAAARRRSSSRPGLEPFQQPSPSQGRRTTVPFDFIVHGYTHDGTRRSPHASPTHPTCIKLHYCTSPIRHHSTSTHLQSRRSPIIPLLSWRFRNQRMYIAASSAGGAHAVGGLPTRRLIPLALVRHEYLPRIASLSSFSPSHRSCVPLCNGNLYVTSLRVLAFGRV